jgi:hypothetical protein
MRHSYWALRILGIVSKLAGAAAAWTARTLGLLPNLCLWFSFLPHWFFHFRFSYIVNDVVVRWKLRVIVNGTFFIKILNKLPLKRIILEGHYVPRITIPSKSLPWLTLLTLLQILAFALILGIKVILAVGASVFASLALVKFINGSKFRLALAHVPLPRFDLSHIRWSHFASGCHSVQLHLVKFVLKLVVF